MPLYEYEVVLPDGSGGDTFEVLQSMSEEPLQVHPTTGEPVRRIIALTSISGDWSEHGMKQRMSDKNLAAQGFTKYVKTSDGHYEKRAGSGPDLLKRDHD